MKRISYGHPEWDRIEKEASNLVDMRFNHVSTQTVGKVMDGSLFEYIAAPSFVIKFHEWVDEYKLEELEIEFKDETENVEIDEDEFLEWAQDNYGEPIEEFYYESEHYPMWGTMFEARDLSFSGLIENHVDELYEIGLGVVQSTDDYRAMLFVPGAGYDFYEAHWIPLFTEIFKWINVTSQKDKEK